MKAAYAILTAGMMLSSASFALAEPLTVYTSRSEELILPLLDAFGEETGIEVQMLSDKAPKLIARLKSEGEATPADVFMPADVASLVGAAESGLLAAIASPTLEENIPAQYRDPDGHWFGLGKRVRAIIYNLETVDPKADLSTYEALSDEKWKGEVLMRSSSHPYNLFLLSAVIDTHGAEAAEEWVEGLVANLARAPQGGDRDQIKAVAAGEGKLAIANSYYYALMMNSEVPEERDAAAATGIYFPNQNANAGEIDGAHVNLSGAAVIAASDRQSEAQQLIEYLSSPEAQAIYAEANQEYPVNPQAEASETLQSFGSFKEASNEFRALAGHVDEALKISDRSGWN